MAIIALIMDIISALIIQNNTLCVCKGIKILISAINTTFIINKIFVESSN